jgi:hypothetical protein
VAPHPPGLISHPLPAGSFVNGVFVASQFSQFSAQEVNLENNSHWISLGMRDGRVEALLPPSQIGETLLYAEGNPGNYMYLDVAGNSWTVAPNQIIQQCGQANSLLKKDGSINLITSSTGSVGGDTIGLMINPSTGINLGNQFGSIIINSTGITLTTGNTSISLGVDGNLNIQGATVNISASLASIAGTLATFIGSGATATNFAIIAKVGGPIVGVAGPSKTVFVAP